MSEHAQERGQIHAGPAKPRKRVQSACNRCRRQKLRCDRERPCALCVRSAVECVTIDSRQVSGGNKRNTILLGAVTKKATRTRPASQSTDESFDYNFLANSTAKAPSTTGKKFVDERADVQDADLSLRHHTQGTSAISLTREIFDQFEASPEDQNQTFAIPGGILSVDPANQQQEREHHIPLHEMIGLDLPPKDVTDFLLDTYLHSVHWFMMLFHEPTFREAYEEIINVRAAPRSKAGFVTLLVMVLACGARYATPESIQKNVCGVDVKSLQSLLLNSARDRIYDLYDEAQLEAVQVSILLSSFYLYHARPNLAFAILGSGIKSAQAMGLHRESSWRGCSQLVKETRRRVWYALYVFDRFASIVFGRPCSINDLDCEVGMVENIDDTTAQHPTLNSMEIMEDGSSERVTIFSYQRYKFRLYATASPILGNVYFLRGGTMSQIIQRVHNIHQELIKWLASLPPELRLHEVTKQTHQCDHFSSETVKIFKLQALALQLAYDNIQILLHRPLLQQNFHRRGTSLSTPRNLARALHDSEVVSDGDFCAGGTSTPTMFSISKNQCWESALRTSKISEHVDVLRIAKNTHAAAYIGIHQFTAGILLSIVALSLPLSSQAQEAKQAIARVVRLSRALGHQTVLSTQSGKILEALVRLILEKEMKELLSGREDFNDHDDGLLATTNPTPRQNSPLTDTIALSDRRRSLPGNNGEEKFQSYDSVFEHEHIYDGPGLGAGFGNTNFDEGLLSLQEVIRQNATHLLPGERTLPLQASKYNGQQSVPPATDETYLQANFGDMDNYVSLFGGSYGGLTDSGPTWFWEANPATF